MPHNRTTYNDGVIIATGNSGPVKAMSQTIGVSIAVTATAGTGETMDISIEWSPDGVNFAAPDGSTDTMTQFIAGAATASKSFAVIAPYYRVLWTLGGATPSFTFVATGIAV